MCRVAGNPVDPFGFSGSLPLFIISLYIFDYVIAANKF